MAVYTNYSSTNNSASVSLSYAIKDEEILSHEIIASISKQGFDSPSFELVDKYAQRANNVFQKVMQKIKTAKANEEVVVEEGLAYSEKSSFREFFTPFFFYTVCFKQILESRNVNVNSIKIESDSLTKSIKLQIIVRNSNLTSSENTAPTERNLCNQLVKDNFFETLFQAVGIATTKSTQVLEEACRVYYFGYQDRVEKEVKTQFKSMSAHQQCKIIQWFQKHFQGHKIVKTLNECCKSEALKLLKEEQQQKQAAVDKENLPNSMMLERNMSTWGDKKKA